MAHGPRDPVLSRALGAALALALIGAAPPPPLELETLAGERVTLAPPARGALVVHYFATWCPSCGEELPELARARAACANEVEIALVDVGDEPAEVRRFLDAHGVAVPVLLDPDGSVWRASTGGRGLPANLVWTAQGRRSEVGPHSPARWRELLAELGCAAG